MEALCLREAKKRAEDGRKGPVEFSLKPGPELMEKIEKAMECSK
jgi:hypothetical protein